MKNNQRRLQAVNSKRHGDKWISLSSIDFFLNRFVDNKMSYRMLLLYYYKSIN